ncbi:MAG: hypothetical protein WCF84_12790 [Anaerolineae bacterium]
MQQMIRKQVYIERRQETRLKRLAKQRGVSEAEIIRRALDRELDAGSTANAPRNPDAWQEALAFMQSRRRLAIAGEEPYRWRREDAYEERLARYDRKSE